MQRQMLSRLATLYVPRTVPFLRTAQAAAASMPEPQLEITSRCVKRLQHLAKQRDTNVVLRVLVDGGGCSGFQYMFELENWEREPTTNTLKKEDDVLIQKDGAHVIVDNISLSFMNGSKVDYLEELISSSFRVLENPNSEGSCGCGVSFSPKQ